MKLTSLLLFAIATAALPNTASAIPLVYQCKIFDYLENGTDITAFQYQQFGQPVAHSSAFSIARIYVSEKNTLHLSIRPKTENEVSKVYSSVTGYSLPERLGVVLSHGFRSPAYAARLSCIF
jgi:hypothetical protein